MVRLTKIYTRTGDDGTTGLGDGSRVPKHGLRIEAYGTVDELSSALGVAIASAAHGAPGVPQELRELLQGIQNDLFDLGADLCVPLEDKSSAVERLRVGPDYTKRLEARIDADNAELEPLSSFVLPGGTLLSARLHVARTVCRRAERLVSRLLAEEGDGRVNPETLCYLNRLSDLLFVLARRANDDGKGDVLWKPGGGRAQG